MRSRSLVALLRELLLAAASDSLPTVCPCTAAAAAAAVTADSLPIECPCTAAVAVTADCLPVEYPCTAAAAAEDALLPFDAEEEIPNTLLYRLFLASGPGCGPGSPPAPPVSSGDGAVELNASPWPDMRSLSLSLSVCL